MIYTLQIEPYEACIEEIESYLETHGGEVEIMKVTPDLGVYADAKNLLIYTMRADDRLVGYAAFWIYEHPHHAGSTWAGNDLVYVHPDHRGEMAVKFFEFIDRELSFCNAITYTFKVQHDHPDLMIHLGYEPTEMVYTKVNK